MNYVFSPRRYIALVADATLNNNQTNLHICIFIKKSRKLILSLNPGLIQELSVLNEYY